MASCVQLNTWLTEARNALHSLLTGATVVEVQDQNLERVRYDRVNIGELRKYIADLESQIAANCGSSNRAQSYGPLRPFF